MKNDLKKLFKKLPGVNGKYKKVMTVYYGSSYFIQYSYFFY